MVGQHVDVGELVHAAGVEHLHGERGEAALRKLRRAFHVEHDPVAGDLLLDSILSVHEMDFIAFPRSPAGSLQDRARWTLLQGLPQKVAHALPGPAPYRAR